MVVYWVVYSFHDVSAASTVATYGEQAADDSEDLSEVTRSEDLMMT